MALVEKERIKRARKAADTLGTGATPIALVQGTGHFRMTTGAIIGLSIFGTGFLVALALGYVLLPGGLLFLFVWSQVRPPRDLIVTDQGLAIFHRSWINGRPTKLVVALPLAPIYAGSPTGSVELELGPERITLKRPEYDRLAAAMGSFAAGPPVPGAVPPPTGGHPH